MSEENHPRIVIFGATGRLGRLLAGRFHDAGHAVLCVARGAKALAALPGQSTVFDLTGVASGKGLVRPGDIVINAAHASHTSAILKLCPSDIERLIVIGSMRYLTRIADVKADEVRDAARSLQNSKLPWVLLHPTMIYGAAGENNVQRMAALIRRFHIVPLPDGGRALIQPIHVKDVVKAIMRVIAKPELCRTVIHLGGPEAVPYWKFLHAIADAAGSWVKVMPLPLTLIRQAARLTALVPGVPVIKDAEVQRLQEDKSVDIRAMKEILGVTPRPLADGLAETFAELDRNAAKGV